MDLGIKGRKAIIGGSSKGLGKACAIALALEGVDVVITARGKDALQETAEEIRSKSNVNVTPVVCDVTTEEGRGTLLQVCPEPDILINNSGGPPPGDFKDFTLDDWRSALEANMLSPIALIHATVYAMMDRGFGRIINITSAAVKAPIPILELSNGARSGLTAAVAILARKAVRHNVTINGLMPGPFDTERLRSNIAKKAEMQKITPEEAARSRMEGNPAGRFGDIAEFGAFAAFLCSSHAGFMTGQNILIDGGDFPGVL